jgi:glycosyltransferase involved in cell wall biosynthesis
VALLSETFSKNMGYLENMLPKYLSLLGVEMHIVATALPPYYQEKSVSAVYKDFAEQLRPGTVETLEGYTLHVVGSQRTLGHMRMAGLGGKLRAIRPDIVQTTAPIGWTALDAAMFKASLGYKLFTGNHYHASVFPLANNGSSFWSVERLRCVATRSIPGWLVSLATEKCYAIADDCADVATRFFGVPRGKIEISPLGVDTELFHPVANASDVSAREALRTKLGFADSEIVCVYSGRFSEDKNPLLLSRAVSELRQDGQPFRGLFVGHGTQLEQIQKCDGCVAHPFVPVQELGALYRAADVGVWPTQESLSMLDAAACGLPVVANHTMTARERLDGNGMAYQLNEQADLVRVLLELRDAKTRRRMGEHGARKMAKGFSWESIARRRVHDYEDALGSRKSSGEKRVSKELLGRIE